MQTITITRIDSGFRNLPPTYLIGDHFDGSNALQHEPVEYVLPEGYTISEDYAGNFCVLDARGQHAAIADAGSHGKWIGPSVEWPHKLQRVEAA